MPACPCKLNGVKGAICNLGRKIQKKKAGMEEEGEEDKPKKNATCI